MKLRTTTILVLLLGILMAFGITAYAETEGNYVYSVTNDVATITGVADKTTFTGEQVIPEKIGDYTVTKIAASAFKDCTGLTAITVPDSVTSIGSGAFSGCSNLEEITLPFVGETRTSTDSYGLFGYIFGSSSYTGGTSTKQSYNTSYSSYSATYYIPTKLTKVIITDATNLAYGAFYNCSNIKEININDELINIGAYAFYYCSNISSINLENVSAIGNNAFYSCSKLANISLSSQLKEIKVSTFYGCSKLLNITIPTSVTSIGNHAFSGCTSFTEITIPDSVTTIGTSAFSGCTSVEKLTIGKNVTTIGGSAFKDLKNVESIVIPNSVTTIGESAFSGCAGLMEITLPFIGESRTSADSYGLFGYIFGTGEYTGGSATEQYYDPSYSSYNRKNYIPTKLTKVTITDATRIPYGAFYNCSKLKEIILNDSINNIAARAFYNCSSISTLNVANAKKIGASAFYQCYNLTTLKLNNELDKVEDYTFYNCSKLTNITIPNSVTSIGNRAFYGCLSFTEVTIPDSVTTVGSYAFAGCKNVERLTIGKGITFIGESSFRDLSNVTSIIVPDSVNEIEESAFSGCANLREITLPFIGRTRASSGSNGLFGYIFGTTEYTGGTATEQNYDSSYSSYTRKNYIPTKLRKVTITDATRISYGAFCACRNITEINLNNEIVDIEGKAFYNVSSVKSFTIPANTTNIGASAFYGCAGITNIIIPDSVVTLGGSAFAYCGNLTSVTLSDKIQAIESSTFMNCTKLQNVSIPDGVTTIGNSAFSGCKSFTYIRVPDAVVSIGNYAFDGCTNVLSVHIGDSVNTIGEYAFRNLSLIENVNVPKNVTSIGSSAFSGCGSIKEITLPFVGKSRSASSSEGLFGYIFGSSSYTGGVSTEQEYSSSYDATYYIPTKLTKVTITDAAKLSYGAFYGCTRISEIVLNNTISSVERYAFYNTAWYSNLKDEFCIIGDNVLIKCNTEENTVIIPNNVKHIAANVFYGNDKILEIVLPDQLESIGEYAFYGVKGVSTYTIPSSVTLIKNNAFSSGITIKCFSGSYAQTYAKNNNITTIILDQSETIGEDIFYYIVNEDNTAEIVGCKTTSTAITIPLTLNDIPVTKIGDSAFKNCQTIKGVTITSNIKIIGSRAFYGCTGLEDVTIPTTVKEVGDYAFYSCTNLETVTIAEGLETIGDYVFYNCKSLVEITLPDTLKTLGSHSFYGCTSANSATIGVNLVGIEPYTFYGCTNLSAVVIGTSVEYIEDYAFYGTKLGRVSIPITTKYIGKHTFENCTSLSRVTLRNGIESIGDYAFSGNVELTQINTPASIKSFGEYCFNDCIKLTSFTVPSNVTRIENSTFNGCLALSNLVLSDNITYIGKNAFSKNAFSSIVIPVKVEEIGDNAFSECKNLTMITLPDSVKELGAGVFYQCNKLSEVSVADTMNKIGKSAFYMTPNPSIIIRFVDGCIDDGLFENQDIAALTIEDGITIIGNNAFAGCHILSDVNYPETLLSIGDYAFYDDINYRIVTLPDNTEYIGAYAFGNILYLDTISFSDKMKDIGDNAFINDLDVSVVIRCVDTVIDESLFDKQNIYRVSFPDTITAVEFNAFNAANYIDLDITYDDGVIDDELLKSDTGMNRVGTIVNISVEDGITTIGESSFAGCKLLPKMILPETVTKIGAYAFYDCNSMASINIPFGVTKINDYTFYGCSSLAEVILPDDIVSIGNYAYYGCTALSELDFNENLQSIGDYAFYNGNMISHLELTDELQNIGDYAFRGCIGIKTVIVPDSVNHLGEGAFYACTTLEEIYLSDSITEFNDKIFYGCVALKKATLSDETDYIADYTFYGCDDCVLYCVGNDYVRDYANNNGLAYNDTSTDFDLVVKAPIKLVYMWGDELDLTGMEVSLVNSSGETIIVPHYTTSGYDKSVLGEQIITVTYKENSATFKVVVEERTCDSNQNVEHIWDDGEVTKEPTTKETGIMTYTCRACSTTREEEIPMLPDTHNHFYGDWEQYDDETHIHECDCGQTQFEDHSWDDGEVTTEPTHTTTGVRTYTCSVCKGTKTEDVDTLEEHEFSEWTEVDEETHTRECACGETETEEHTWNNGVVTTPATSTTTGIKTFTCTGCLTTKEEIIDMITDTHEHSYGEWVSVDEENHIRTCECGEEEIASHEMDEEGKVVKEPTHFESGERVYKCKYCDYSISEEIEATDVHEFGKWKYIDVETHSRTCDCGEVETVEHSWDDGVVTTKPTLTATGIKTFTCSDCKGTKEVIIAVIEPSGRLVVGNVTGKAGDTVEVKVTLSDNEGIAGMVLNLTYDEELTLIEAVQGDALPNMAFTAPGDYSKNPVNLVWDAMEADASNGHIVTLKFQISEDAEERDYEVNLSYKPGAICDNDMNDVDFTITNGVITVKNYTPGDVNGDGEVDVKDIIILRRFIAGGYEITYVEAAVDINRDGSNDAKDIITLRRFVADGYGIILK